MSYARMDHADWLARHLRTELTPFQEKVADIIGMVAGGIYNAPINWKSAEIDSRFVVVIWRGDLSTWDFDALTKLVLLAHAARIRVSIEAAAYRYLRIMFHPRKHDGWFGQRHPSIAEAVASFSEYLPAHHRVRYEKGPGA